MTEPKAEQRRGWRDWLADLFSGDPVDRTEVLDMLQDAAQRGIVNGEAFDIIDRTLRFSDMRARDIMIPRSQAVFIRAEDSPQAFLPQVVESQHSRFPVIGDDLDDIKGILHAKDLLPLLVAGGFAGFDIKDCIRPVAVVPESKRLHIMLQEFQQTRNHMAAVIDEYGHVSGVITIEDVLEQIVGEIEDEHDVDDDSHIKRHGGGSYTVKAVTPIREFNEYFEANFDEAASDTIGGAVLREFGRLPEREERVSIGKFDFRVLHADSRRIQLLELNCRDTAG